MGDGRSAASTLRGGCQCGAVRYELLAAPDRTSICWCRMCQKAHGSYVAPYSRVRFANLRWTRGEPGVFRSSAAAERYFCAGCGTPLAYRFIAGGNISVSTTSLDEPTAAPSPSQQYFPERRPAFAEELCRLPEVTTSSWVTADLAPQLASRQHPDHETDGRQG